MQPRLHRSSARGHADHGWLDSHHTFSFAGFHDPTRMGFGHLRVINEDRVEGGRGFGMHSHRDMEIISVPLAGQLGHRDTLGTGSTIRPGEVQLMSAGRGIAHSEMNVQADVPVHFLQIWVLPAVTGTEPRYQQVDFGLEAGVVRVVSPDGGEGSLQIQQDMELWRVRASAGATSTVPVTRARQFIQVTHGAIEVAGVSLRAGDGLELHHTGSLAVTTVEDSQFLVFDLL